MILICSANFVGQLKDTLIGSLSIFGVMADFLPHLHQILNYFIKCKTRPAYLSDTAQKSPWGFYAASIKGVIPLSQSVIGICKKIICSSHPLLEHLFFGWFPGLFSDQQKCFQKKWAVSQPLTLLCQCIHASSSFQQRSNLKYDQHHWVPWLTSFTKITCFKSSSGTCLDPISLG